MSRRTWGVTSAISLVAMVIGLLASIVIGDCKELVNCGDSQIPMKCHWTYVATTVLYVFGIIAVAGQFLFKTTEGRRASVLAPLFLALAAAVMVSPIGIGTCAMEMSNCHTTAYIIGVVTAVVAVISVIQLVKANPEDADKPKLTD